MSPKNEPTLVEGGLTSAQRQANKRARDKGLPEPFVKVAASEIQARKSQHDIDLAFAEEQDAKETFYKAECRPLVELLGVYEGAELADKEAEDDETSKSKKSKKKSNQPNPSVDKVTVSAIWGPDGEPVEPKCWPKCDHTTCGKHLRKTFEIDEILSFQKWLDVRDKCRKNLFYLSRILGKTLFHCVHQFVCDQYISKNFQWFPGYGLEDFKEQFEAQKKYRTATQGTGIVPGVTLTNELLLLEQRGGYKSTIDGIDCVQWLLNAPDCRIMVITAFRQLAKKRAKEIKAYFYLPPRGKPSPFHMIFPEYVTRGVMGRSDGPLECPARVNANFFKEDSMWFTSMESSATGDHCCILKGDDIVDLKNSADEEMRQELKDDFNSRKTDLLDPWGFVDITGTRYYTDDMYGSRFVPNPESKRVSPFRYSCRGAFQLSIEDQILYSLPLDNPKRLTVRQALEEERGTLVFAAKNGWARLRDLYDEKGERVFKNQQMNEATDKSELTDFINPFTLDALRLRLRPKEYVPAHAEYFQLWDLAYSEYATSDFSVGITAARWTLPDGRVACAVTDAVHGKWKATELSTNIARFYSKHPQTRKIFMEKINGYEWLYTHVMTAGALFGVPAIQNAIHPFDIDNTKGAKRNRIRNLDLLMTDDRLSFIAGSTWNDECFKQFTDFTGEPSTKNRKDDYPDVISFMFKCILPYDVIKGMTFEDTAEMKKKREEDRKESMRRDQYHRMHGPGMGGTIKTPGPPTPQGTTAKDHILKVDMSGGRPQQPPPDPTPQRQLTPREQAQQQMMKILPPGLRRRGQ